MGWFLSTLIFQDIVTYILDTCASLLPDTVEVVHQIDDILIAGTNSDDVQTAMDIIINAFIGYSFFIRKEKCEGPSNSGTFCGLKLFDDGSVKPFPIKRQLNEIASKTAADLFANSKSIEQLKFALRSWLGTANCFNKWLPTDLRNENLFLHSILPKLESGELSKQEISDRAVAFVDQLCNWWLEHSNGLYGGSNNLENTIVIVDANASGWSGCIFRLSEVEKERGSYPLPFSLTGLLSIHESELVPPPKSMDDFTLLPVRFDGARWSSKFEMSQSSTWRERAAAMLIVHRNKEVLSGKVFIVSDNRNLVGS
jgi:hypothetical protein